jgi:hypothetical protein
MNLNPDGYLLIGYNSSNGSYKLQVNSQIFATSSTIATSDGRYKENINDLNNGIEIVKLLRPVSFTWKKQQDILKNNSDDKIKVENDIDDDILRERHNFPDGVQVGFIAQEVKESLKDKKWIDSLVKQNIREEVVDTDGNVILPEEDFYGIAEGNIIPILTSALKEAINEIESLKERITILELQ